MAKRGAHLLTWVDEGTKLQFLALAQARGMTCSALLKQSVEGLLGASGTASAPPDEPAADVRSTRVTVRLLARDLLVLRARAAARGMPTATYVAALASGHVRNLAPLPTPERQQLRKLASELGAIGRNVNQLVRLAYRDGTPVVPRREELMHFFNVCRVVPHQTRALLKANAESWKVGGQT